jgi:hypothetical protein
MPRLEGTYIRDNHSTESQRKVTNCNTERKDEKHERPKVRSVCEFLAGKLEHLNQLREEVTLNGVCSYSTLV